MAGRPAEPNPARAGGRTQGCEHRRDRWRGHGQGDGQPDTHTNSLDADVEQLVTFIGRTDTKQRRSAQYTGRRRVQDIIRQPPGINNAAHCNSVAEAFNFFTTPPMIGLVVIEINREAELHDGQSIYFVEFISGYGLIKHYAIVQFRYK